MEEKITKAWQLFDKGAYEASEEIYLECLKKVMETDREMYQSVLMGLLYVESFMQKFDEARDYAKRLKNMAENAEEKHIAIHQLGMVERMAENYEEALKLFMEEAVLIQEAFPKEDTLISANLYEQAYVNFKMGNLIQAEKSMLCALEHAEKSKDSMCIGCAYRGLGEIAMALNNLGRAEDYFRNAIKAFTETGDAVAVEEVNVFLYNM